MNLRSLSEIMALGRPQSSSIKVVSRLSAYRSADQVPSPSIKAIFRKNLSVTVRQQSNPSTVTERARIKSIEIV